MEKIAAFKFMDLKSTVNLENPTDIFAIFEDYRRTDKNTPVRVFMCRQVVLGRRDLIDVFSLKKRQYLGITSMDSELSLIGANMALVRALQMSRRAFFQELTGHLSLGAWRYNGDRSICGHGQSRDHVRTLWLDDHGRWHWRFSIDGQRRRQERVHELWAVQCARETRGRDALRSPQERRHSQQRVVRRHCLRS